MKKLFELDENIFDSVIFDLDGTLIDSSAGILSSFQQTLDKHNLIPQVLLTKDIIGPPLLKILTLLVGEKNTFQLPQLVATFKSSYDVSGYKLSEVFDGVNEMLLDFKQRGIKLYIATNKRYEPTMSIICYLDWVGIFDGIYSLDYFNFEEKAEVLQKIVNIHHLEKNKVLYVGDREDDKIAAANAGLSFAWATWGFCQH